MLREIWNGGEDQEGREEFLCEDLGEVLRILLFLDGLGCFKIFEG